VVALSELPPGGLLQDSRNSTRDQGFAPLFRGFNDLGTWVHGEIFGAYVLRNRNLNSCSLRLGRVPPCGV
jgi:hypothetical protein